MAAPTVQIFPNTTELAEHLARAIHQYIEETLQNQETFSFVLAGGGTPERLYRRLSGAPFNTAIPWPRVHFFWGDERFVPPTDPESNERAAREALLQHVPVPAANIHPFPTTGDRFPLEAARDYEQQLKKFFPGAPWPAFDLVLLGVGEDGHTASLFPNTPGLGEQERWCLPITGAPKPPAQRLTLTFPVFNHARRVYILAAGAAKAPVLQKVFSPEASPFPVERVSPHSGGLVWWVDQAAAPR